MSADGPKRLSAWSQFANANRRICHNFFQPRIYTLSHASALEWWFRRRIESLAARGRILESGSSREFPLSRLLKASVAACEATDIEDVPPSYWPEGVSFRACTASALPFDDNRFDAVVVRSVLEHVSDPPAVFREMARVMKPGARVFLNLPNKWDYVSVISRVAGP